MITYSKLDRFPEFLKFYNCLEFIDSKYNSDVFEISNMSTYWDYNNTHNNTKRIYLDISLRFKYYDYILFLNLNGRNGGKLNMTSDIMFNLIDENNKSDISFHYQICKDIDIPEFKKSLSLEFDKKTRFKDITDSLVEIRSNGLYDKLIDEGIIFNNMKPYIEDIKNFELMFLNKVDFINDIHPNLIMCTQKNRITNSHK